jgi:hypothetical protein
MSTVGYSKTTFRQPKQLKAKIARGAKSSASAAIEVDAKDDAARPFYAKFGFLSLTDDRLHMELPMETARDQNLNDEKHPGSPGLVEGTFF